jgi:uncharacterized protein YlxW (UPF0749 family)
VEPNAGVQGAVAAAEPGPSAGHRTATVITGLVAVLVGILFAASASTARGTDLRGGRAVEIHDLVVREAQRVAEAEEVIAGLEAEVSDLVAVRGGGVALAASQRRTAALAPAAGLTAVVGPGLRVALDDAPRPKPGQQVPGNPAPNDLVVHQQDVQAVVNALWRGGASAVQVMDQRIVSTSAVRCVGNTLLLQGRVYSPPFTIAAVGDPAALTAALELDPLVTIYREYVALYGLGYVVRSEPALTIPAFTGSVMPLFASPAALS